MSEHQWSSSQPVVTHCQHGLDLRLNPRCYLCAPQPDTASRELREDAGYLSDAAKHLTDHLSSEHPDWYCEDMDVVQHFAVKIRAALAATEGEPAVNIAPHACNPTQCPEHREAER